MIKINSDDKALIRAYVKWCSKKGFYPTEYEISQLIDNMNHDHRYLVEQFLDEIIDNK